MRFSPPRPGSGREEDGSGGVATSCQGECLGSIGKMVAGGDRDLLLAICESSRELAQLVSVRADAAAGDCDAALPAGLDAQRPGPYQVSILQ